MLFVETVIECDKVETGLLSSTYRLELVQVRGVPHCKLQFVTMPKPIL